MTRDKTLFLSAIALLISIILSKLLDFSLSNTWQASVVLFAVFGPWWIYFWKQTKDHHSQHPFLCLGSRFVLILLFIGYLISIILFPLMKSR